MSSGSRAAGLLLASFALCACAPGARPAPPPPTQVGVAVLSAGPVTLSDELTGRVTPTQIADVRPQVGGVVLRRLFTEGAQVRAGEPLYQIDPRLYVAARDQAAAQLETAEAVLQAAQTKAGRFRTLKDTEAASRQDVDDALAASAQAQAAVHQYRAALRTARVNLGFTRIDAPVSGRIGRSTVTAGALVSAGQTAPLATVQALDPVYVDVTRSTRQLLELRRARAQGDASAEGADVRLKLEDGSQYPLAGRLQFSEVSVDAQSGAVVLRARFPNPQGLLLPGMFVRVELPEIVAPRAVLAPQQGIVRDAQGGATALVVDARGRVSARAVGVARAVGDRWLVTSGLAAGDRLIVEGADKVSPGETVAPVVVGRGG